jgi:hypothetical protein
MMEPTKNAPNPQKFLKEVRSLIPHLTSQGHIETGMNREKARANGFKAVKEMTKERDEQKKLQIENQYRLAKISQRVDEELKRIAPLLYQIVQWSQKVVLFKWFGWSWNIAGSLEEVDGVPGIECTIINLYRWGKVKKIIRIVWEDPKLKGKIVWQA